MLPFHHMCLTHGESQHHNLFHLPPVELNIMSKCAENEVWKRLICNRTTVKVTQRRYTVFSMLIDFTVVFIYFFYFFFFLSLWHQADKRWWFGCSIRLIYKSWHLFLDTFEDQIALVFLSSCTDITHSSDNFSQFSFFCIFLILSFTYKRKSQGVSTHYPDAPFMYHHVRTDDKAKTGGSVLLLCCGGHLVILFIFPTWFESICMYHCSTMFFSTDLL